MKGKYDIRNCGATEAHPFDQPGNHHYSKGFGSDLARISFGDSSEMARRWLALRSLYARSKLAQSILKEYGKKQPRSSLEYGKSMGRVCLADASGMKYALRFAAVLLVMMVG